MSDIESGSSVTTIDKSCGDEFQVEKTKPKQSARPKLSKPAKQKKSESVISKLSKKQNKIKKRAKTKACSI